MARVSSEWSKGIDVPEVSSASTPRAPVPLQSLSKLSMSTAKPLNFGQLVHFFNGGQSSCSTTASRRSSISTEYSSLNHSACTSPCSSKAKDVVTQFPFSAGSFRAKQLEQSWTPVNKTGYMPASSPSSTVSLKSASVAARRTVMNRDVSERSKVIRLSPGSKDLLKFIYECLDTDSDGIICIADLNQKCITFPEVATCLGMNLCCKGDQSWGEFLKSGQVEITYEDLCAWVSALRRAKRPDISLQTRRKLTFDFIEHNFFTVTLFTIATVFVKHPTFVPFLMPPENAGNVIQVTDYLSQVDLAGGYAFSSAGRSFFDFCCFLDHISGNNAQSRSIAPTESLHGELMMFLSRKRNKLSESHDEVNELRGRHTNAPLTSNRCFIFPNTLSSPSHDLSAENPRPLSSMRSDQSGENKETVCLPSGKVMLGRGQKPLRRSDLSFRDCGVLIGPDSMMIFDEDGHPFTKRKLCMAADGKPALDEHHRLQKLEYEKVLPRENLEKGVATDLSYCKRLIRFSGQERQRASVRGSGPIFSGRHSLPVSKGEVDGRDERHRLTRELEYKQTVQKEAAPEKLNDLLFCSEKLFPVSGQRRTSKISTDRAFCNASSSFVSSRNGLPLTKDEVILGPSVDSVLALLDGPDWVALIQKNE